MQLPDSLTKEEFGDAIQYLQGLEGYDPESGDSLKLILPGGRFPGSRPGGTDDVLYKDAWDHLLWNPEGYFGCSPKPPWRAIVDAGRLMKIKRFENRLRRVINDFRVWTRAQICGRIFGAHDISDEIINRSNGNYTNIQEERKAETILIHTTQRQRIREASNQEELFAREREAQQAITEHINTYSL